MLLSRLSKVVEPCRFSRFYSQVKRAVACGEEHLKIYGELAAQAFSAFRPLWKVRPKTHHLHHKIVRRMKMGSRLNPRVMSRSYLIRNATPLLSFLLRVRRICDFDAPATKVVLWA